MLLLELRMLLLMWLRLSHGDVSAVEEALSSINRSLLRRTPKLNTSSWCCCWWWWWDLTVSNCLYRALIMLCWLKLVCPMSMLSSSLTLGLLVEAAEGQELVIDRSAALSKSTDAQVSCICRELLRVELELVDEANELLDLCCSCCCTASKLFCVIVSSARNRQSNLLSGSSSSTTQCEVLLSLLLLELARDTRLAVFDVLRIRLHVEEEEDDEDDEVLLADGGAKFFCVNEVNETVLASLEVPAIDLTFWRLSVAGTSREYESLKSSSRTACNFY